MAHNQGAVVQRSGWSLGCLAGLMAIAACGGPGYPVGVVLSSAQLLYTDNQADFLEAEELVVRDQRAYEDVWARSGTRQVLRPVNFDREMLVVLSAGRSSPGDSIQIQTAGEREEGFDDFHIVYRVSTGCEEFPGASYPLQVVRLKRSDKTPVFEQRREQAARCRGM